jgi:hypothetical protein
MSKKTKFMIRKVFMDWVVREDPSLVSPRGEDLNY